jgi:hypothetical protein
MTARISLCVICGYHLRMDVGSQLGPYEIVARTAPRWQALAQRLGRTAPWALD